MADRQVRVFGWLLIGVWLSALYLLMPLPLTLIAAIPEANPATLQSIIEKEQKSTGLPRAEVERAALSKLSRQSAVIWVHWIAIAVLLVLGLLAGVGALRGWRYWGYLAILSSALYLTGWAISLAALPASDHRSVLDSYVAYLVNVLHSDGGLGKISYIHVEVILPTVHLVIASFLAYVRPQPPSAPVPQA